MPLALQMHLVMLSKYSKFHVDIFDSFQIKKLNKQFDKNSKVIKGQNLKKYCF